MCYFLLRAVSLIYACCRHGTVKGEKIRFVDIHCIFVFSDFFFETYMPQFCELKDASFLLTVKKRRKTEDQASRSFLFAPRSHRDLKTKDLTSVYSPRCPHMFNLPSITFIKAVEPGSANRIARKSLLNFGSKKGTFRIILVFLRVSSTRVHVL